MLLYMWAKDRNGGTAMKIQPWNIPIQGTGQKVRTDQAI